MSSIGISAIVFACVFGGAMFGMFLRAVLPEHHLNPESKDVVKLGMELAATSFQEEMTSRHILRAKSWECEFQAESNTISCAKSRV